MRKTCKSQGILRYFERPVKYQDETGFLKDTLLFEASKVGLL